MKKSQLRKIIREELHNMEKQSTEDIIWPLFKKDESDPEIGNADAVDVDSPDEMSSEFQDYFYTIVDYVDQGMDYEKAAFKASNEY
jgi:hypothetical protein